jgi:hypothetical protein
MSVIQQDAAQALRLAETAGRRSKTLRGYQSAAPHLILWGCVYSAAYTFSHFRPAQAGAAWLVAVPLALIVDAVLLRHDRGGRANWAVAASVVATFLVFITATAAIMRPHDPRQIGAFVPLVVACAYTIEGLRRGHRLMFAGIALGVLTLFGYFVLPAYFMLWMAAVGGGALVLTGLWLRRA